MHTLTTVIKLFVVSASSVSVNDMLDQLKQEQQTWQLVSSLYSDRLDSRSQIDVDEDVASVGHAFRSNNCQRPVSTRALSVHDL